MTVDQESNPPDGVSSPMPEGTDIEGESSPRSNAGAPGYSDEEARRLLAAEKQREKRGRGGQTLLRVLIVLLGMRLLPALASPNDLWATIVELVVLVALLAWLSSYAGRRRFATAILSALACVALLLGGRLHTVPGRIYNGWVRSGMTADIDELRDHLRSRSREGGFVVMDPAHLAELATSLESAGSRLTGWERANAQCLAAAYRRMHPILKDAIDLATQFEEAGGIDVASVSSMDDLRTRLDFLRRSNAANSKLTDELSQMRAQVRVCVLNAGFSKSQAQAAGQTLEGPRLEATLRVRHASAALNATLIGLLEHLEETWGRWKIDEATGGVVFENSSASDEYGRLRTALGEKLDQRSRLQREMLQP